VPTSGPLWRKEVRELLASRSYLLLLLIVSALVGHAFVTAVETYAELSGAGGGPSALAQGMNPLDGVLVPTFGAYDLAATLLLPFVVIRLVAAERASGAWTILVQSPAGVRLMVAVKAAALLAAWIVALLPGLTAVLLWRAYGGHVSGGELSGLLLGHLLRAGLTIGLAAAAAAVVEQSASAAVLTLGVTVGSWALDFMAAVRGGAVARIAAFTPTATLRLFEHGLVRASVITVMLATTVAGLLIAATWLDPGAAPARRVLRSVLVALAFGAVAATGAQFRRSWDVSEDRRYSFSPEDEAALRRLPGTLRVESHLAAEDPRLVDLRQAVLDRLERVVPRLEVVDSSRSRTGLFARPDAHYGEVWYEIGGSRKMERSTIEHVVLETIYGLAGVSPPVVGHAQAYPGYPLAARPAFAAPVFYLLWPALILGSFWLARRATPAPRRERVTRGSDAPG
jgi:ABC-type transport system involved in multi-copper enzyme maturation permease subunit